MPTCPACGQTQYSRFDQLYLERHGSCWSCDRIKWMRGEMTLEEFERRENAVKVI